MALLRQQFPSLRIEGRVRIARGCDIYVGQGSTLTIRDCALAPDVTLVTAPGATLTVDADFIGPGSIIVARQSVTIGAGSKVAEGVTIRDANHDRSVPLRERRFVTSPVAIGEDVWVAAKATVLMGATIGDRATVAAGAVVTRDVAPGVTVVGVPARPVRESQRQ